MATSIRTMQHMEADASDIGIAKPRKQFRKKSQEKYEKAKENVKFDDSIKIRSGGKVRTYLVMSHLM